MSLHSLSNSRKGFMVFSLSPYGELMSERKQALAKDRHSIPWVLLWNRLEAIFGLGFSFGLGAKGCWDVVSDRQGFTFVPGGYIPTLETKQREC